MAEKAILYDPTRCTACRGCQVACKQWNENDDQRCGDKRVERPERERKTEHKQDDSRVHRVPDVSVGACGAHRMSAVFLDPDHIGSVCVFPHGPERETRGRDITDEPERLDY